MKTTDKKLANLAGYTAIMLWSFSALCIQWTPDIPPFLLAGMTSVGGFMLFAFGWLKEPQKLSKALRQPKQVWALFFLSVVLYRGFYLTGLKLAPIVEANLLQYLWPLLIIILSAVIDGKKIKPLIYAGAAACFGGVVCIGLAKNGGQGFSFAPGHLLAIIAACLWSSYSVLTRRFPGALTDMIGIMHLVAVAVFMSLHVLFEVPVHLFSIPWHNWIGVTQLSLAISLGYSLWDKAMTHGDREHVATTAYFTPLMSIVWLILFTDAKMTPLVWLAAVLILGGSQLSRLASKDKKLQKTGEAD